jgi:rod shape-determining protein MreC
VRTLSRERFGRFLPVYDKTTRRRRAVLVLLVALSLILLTAYFGETSNGGLHSVQRGFLTIVSPIQDGANKALKPVRNLFGWFSATLHAKGQRDELLKQNDKLRAQLIEKQSNERAYRRLSQLYELDKRLSISDYHPVNADVTAQSPNLWDATVDIDEGTAAGVKINDPVIVGEGLVGKITQAETDGAQVGLITNSAVEVGAMIATTGAPGLVKPKVGDPNDLLLQYLPLTTPVSVGNYVVTSGTISSKGASLFPRNIPIGQVTSVQEEGPYRSVNVQPLAQLHGLETVQVLTYALGSKPARISSYVGSTPPQPSAGSAGTG